MMTNDHVKQLRMRIVVIFMKTLIRIFDEDDDDDDDGNVTWPR